MDLGIAERVALVTGAGQGIGRQICLTLGEEGVRVAVNDLFQERADVVAEEIRGAGGQAMGVAGDVTDGDSVSAMVRRVAEEWGGVVDILVNNAGIPVIADPSDTSAAAGSFFAQSDRAQWDRTMGLITYGVLNCSRAVVEGMSEQRWGRIVNIVSDAGRVGEPRLVAYSQAKAGVGGSARRWRKRWGASA